MCIILGPALALYYGVVFHFPLFSEDTKKWLLLTDRLNYDMDLDPNNEDVRTILVEDPILSMFVVVAICCFLATPFACCLTQCVNLSSLTHYSFSPDTEGIRQRKRERSRSQ